MSEKKYYIHDGASQKGPFSVEDLLLNNINSDTPIWYDGMRIGQLPEK